jgi:hypothetical protein
MNEALKNTILLADYDEETQQQVVDAVEKIVYHYLQKNLHAIGVDIVSTQQSNIERIALRAVRTHFIDAPNIN